MYIRFPAIYIQSTVPSTMKSLIPILLSSLSLLITIIAQSTPLSRAEAALDVLQSWYNTSTGIWDTCGWWNDANCMTVLADLALTNSKCGV